MLGQTIGRRDTGGWKTMGLRLIVALLILLPLGGCSDSSDGPDENTIGACGIIGLNTKIIGGVSCSDLERAPVVRVVAVLQIEGELVNAPVCSGTMISPDTVLTAGHCFTRRVSGYRVEGFGIYLGEPGDGDFIEARQVLVAPGYRFDNTVERIFDDAALIQLRQNVSLPLIPVLQSGGVDLGEVGYVYGYGATEAGNIAGSIDFFSLEGGAMTIENVTSDHLFVAFSGSGVNVCNGDSGGPLVLIRNGLPVVAGVVSMGSVDGCVAGDVTTFTNMQSPSIVNWLQQYVADNYLRSLE